MIATIAYRNLGLLWKQAVTCLAVSGAGCLLADPGSPSAEIEVWGAVYRPGIYRVGGDVAPSNVLKMAGGVREALAAGARYNKVVRLADGVCSRSWAVLPLSQKEVAVMPWMDGDSLVVPFINEWSMATQQPGVHWPPAGRCRISVWGDVLQPGYYVVSEDHDVASLLSLASEGHPLDTSKVRIEVFAIHNVGRVRIHTAEMGDPAFLRGRQWWDFDALVVSTNASPIQGCRDIAVWVEGAVHKPGRRSVSCGAVVIDALRSAGGIRDDLDSYMLKWRDVRVYDAHAVTNRAERRFSRTQVLDPKWQSPVLSDGDTVSVPYIY